MFNYYDSNNCTADPTDEDPNPGLAKRKKSRRDGGNDLDGVCLALIAFNSLAFICDGVAPHNDKVLSRSTTAVAPTTASSSTIPSIMSMFISISYSNRSATETTFSATRSPATTSSATRSPATISSATSAPATSAPARSSLAAKVGLFAGTKSGSGVGSATWVFAIAALSFMLL